MQSRLRGRPATFQDEQRRMLAALIREHGARGAMKVSPVPVCLNTLLRIAQEHGIILRRGRRSKLADEQSAISIEVPTSGVASLVQRAA